MKTREVRRAALEFVKTLVIAFVLAQFIMTSVAQAFQVEQYSMEPNLLPRDRVLVNKFVYRFRPPRPGEIVVLHPPNDPGRNYIKRVVAVPGQTVQIRQAHVYVDGRTLREPYLAAATDGMYGPAKVPSHEVFVLGDNRDNSEDSRAFGFVPDTSVVGEAILIYWPPVRLRVLW
ncbi:MAG TPA: signal peptidase I [bacterium]|nr:signal peptidase I [bacterium]